MDFEQIIIPYRQRKSTISRTPEEEYYSDRSRIIFSSSFRRMMQKAQVFCLDPNSSVRNRLTHSLEVADIGKTLALKVADNLIKEKKLKSSYKQQFVTIVENACLIHDIGNPPFGHFGEEAIKRWFKEHASEMKNKIDSIDNVNDFDCCLSDFTEFDGNPQGIRILTRLLCDLDKHSLNLTLPTILSAIKYTRTSCQPNNDLFKKKCGYFRTELPLIEELYEQIPIQIGQRYPLVYLVETADDICFCLSDIADGFEKGMIDSRSFKDNFRKIWEEESRKINYL